MNTETQLVVQQPSVAIMLQEALSQGITKDNADALGKMMELYERMESKRAEQAFAEAFVALQAEMPAVQAVKSVKNRDGTERYRYAPYEEIMRAVSPMLTKHGFTVTFNTALKEGRMEVECTLLHKAGHLRSNSFAVRIGAGPAGTNEMQADGAAKTYAKRGALCDALNIVVEVDGDGNDDARSLGGPITPEEAANLADWVEATKSDKAKFLAFATGKDEGGKFEDIRANRLDELHNLLRKRENDQKAKA